MGCGASQKKSKSQTPAKQSIHNSIVSIQSPDAESVHTRSPTIRNIQRFKIVSNKTERPPSLIPKSRISVHDHNPNISSSGHVGRCSVCPHCRQLAEMDDYQCRESAPVWITGTSSSKFHQHILMDNYDEIAMRKKLIAEHGCLPGCYDYRPHLTIINNHD